MNLKEKIDFEFLKYQLKKKWEAFKTKLFMVWFFGSIALMVILAENGQNLLSTCLFGHYFAVFGFLAYNSFGMKKNIKKAWQPLLVMIVGLVIMLVCLLLYFEII